MELPTTFNYLTFGFHWTSEFIIVWFLMVTWPEDIFLEKLWTHRTFFLQNLRNMRTCDTSHCYHFQNHWYCEISEARNPLFQFRRFQTDCKKFVQIGTFRTDWRSAWQTNAKYLSFSSGYLMIAPKPKSREKWCIVLFSKRTTRLLQKNFCLEPWFSHNI